MPGAVAPASVSDTRPRVGALVTLFFGTAFIFANMYTTQAILPVFSQDFHISAPTAGLSISLLVLAVALASLFYGPLSDSVGRKPVMVGTGLLVTIPTTLCAFAPNFTILLIFRVMQGLLVPGLIGIAIAYVNEEFAGRWRGLVMGIYVSGQVLGGLVARVGSAALTGFYDWRIALLAFAPPTLLAALIMWRYLPETRSRQISERQGEQSAAEGSIVRRGLHDMLGHLHNRRLVGAFVIGFSSFFGFIGIFTYLPYYLTGPQFRLPTIALSLVYLLWATGACSPAAGVLAGRIGSRRSIACTATLSCVGLLITLIPLLPVVMIGLSLLTLGMFSTMPAINLYLGEQATTARGTAASMYLSLYYFGGSLGAVIPGFALLWDGWPGVTLLCLGMMLIALASDAILCR